MSIDIKRLRDTAEGAKASVALHIPAFHPAQCIGLLDRLAQLTADLARTEQLNAALNDRYLDLCQSIHSLVGSYLEETPIDATREHDLGVIENVLGDVARLTAERDEAVRAASGLSSPRDSTDMTNTNDLTIKLQLAETRETQATELCTCLPS